MGGNPIATGTASTTKLLGIPVDYVADTYQVRTKRVRVSVVAVAAEQDQALLR